MRFAAPRLEEAAALVKLIKRKRRFIRRNPVRPERIELVYFPYHLFEIPVADAGRERTARVAVDGVLGIFSFVETDGLDFSAETDAPRFRFQIGMEEAKGKAREAYRWSIFGHVFHRLKCPTIGKVREARRIYYPYWVAYYRMKKGYNFGVVDGISGDPVSVRMRRAFLAAFSRGEPLIRRQEPFNNKC